VKHNFPSLLKFISVCYGDSSKLCFQNEAILSEEGAQQGDPLGPFSFCLAANTMISKMTSDFNVWYIDDGTLGGSVTQLLQDISTIQVEGPQIGLVLNDKKCEIVTSDPDIVSSIRRLLPAAIHIDPSDCTVLGAPVGGTRATDAVL
jgi:hypothetical protein